MTDENQTRKLSEWEFPREVYDAFKALDMVREMQLDALAGMMRGSYREMEDGIKKVEVLTELQQSGSFPFRGSTPYQDEYKKYMEEEKEENS